MKLIRRQLGDGIRIKHGFAFLGKFFSDQGRYIILTPGNFYEEGGFKPRPEKDRFYTGIFPHDYVLKKGDLIIAMTEQGPGLLGSSAFIPEDDTYLHNQRLGLVDEIDADVFEKRYLFHLFNSRTVRSQIYGSATGTKVKHTSPKRVYKAKVLAPDVDKQEKISSIIENYYQLIKINRHRIQLFEETARFLYREWFVYFRFPGHEKTKKVEGVPEGWTRGSLEDITTIKKGRNITFEQAIEGNIPVVGGGLEPTYYHNEANVCAPVITISASGANAGYVNLYHSDVWASDCSYMNRETTKHIFYLFLMLKSLQAYMTGLQVGVAQPHVYPKDLNRSKVLIPSDDICERFELLVTPMFDLIKNLKHHNQKLMQARDLLLPRLMRGAIEVSGFDTKTSQEAET